MTLLTVRVFVPHFRGGVFTHFPRVAFPKGGQMMLGHHAINLCPPACPKTRPMKNDPILSQIAEYCRQADMAQTTFGRPALNDAKLVHRLRDANRTTIAPLHPIH